MTHVDVQRTEASHEAGSDDAATVAAVGTSAANGTPAGRTAPNALRHSSDVRMTIALAVLGVFVTYVPIPAVSVAVTRIATSTRAGTPDLQWITDAYRSERRRAPEMSRPHQAARMEPAPLVIGRYCHCGGTNDAGAPVRIVSRNVPTQIGYALHAKRRAA